MPFGGLQCSGHASAGRRFAGHRSARHAQRLGRIAIGKRKEVIDALEVDLDVLQVNLEATWAVRTRSKKLCAAVGDRQGTQGREGCALT